MINNRHNIYIPGKKEIKKKQRQPSETNRFYE